MEFVSNGALDSLISDQEGELPEVLVYKIARGAAEGMKSLAAQSIVHRDLGMSLLLLLLLLLLSVNYLLALFPSSLSCEKYFTWQ